MKLSSGLGKKKGWMCMDTIGGNRTTLKQQHPYILKSKNTYKQLKFQVLKDNHRYPGAIFIIISTVLKIKYMFSFEKGAECIEMSNCIGQKEITSTQFDNLN